MSTLQVTSDAAPAACTIGPSLEELQLLATLGIEAVPTLCISKETLSQIAQINNLHDKIESIWRKAKPATEENAELIVNKVNHIFDHIHIPEELSHHLVKHISAHFGHSYVTVFASLAGFTHETYCHENVKGEANIIQSLLQIWSCMCIDALKQSHTSFSQECVIPDSLVIQQLFDAEASGVAYTKHPLTEDKSQVVIRSVYGIQSLKDNFEKTDTFTVDIRTWNVISTRKSTQTVVYSRAADQFVAAALSQAKQNELSLTNEQAIELAHKVRAIKLQFPDHKKIWWNLVNGKLMILGIRTFDVTKVSRMSPHHKTITKILLSLTGTSTAKEIDPHLSYPTDGIGLLRSDYFLSEMGVHPLHLIHSKHAQTYLTSVTDKIGKVLNDYLHPFTIYQSSHFSSQEFSKLLHAGMYEPDEANPFFGFRGGSRVYLQPQLLNFELKIVRKLLEQTNNDLGFALPWVRSPQELAYLKQLVVQQGLHEQKLFQLWWQLSTPENILNFEQYPLDNISGMVIDINTIQYVLMGIDPSNEELLMHYPVSSSSVEQILSMIHKQLAVRSLPVDFQTFVLLSDYSSSILNMVVQMGFQGVIVQPELLPSVSAQIQEAEANPLFRYQNSKH